MGELLVVFASEPVWASPFGRDLITDCISAAVKGSFRKFSCLSARVGNLI